jgi:hypothetical protein
VDNDDVPSKSASKKGNPVICDRDKTGGHLLNEINHVLKTNVKI